MPVCQCVICGLKESRSAATLIGGAAASDLSDGGTDRYFPLTAVVYMIEIVMVVV